MSKLDSERGNFLEEESGGSFSDSDSEPEIPALPGVVEKKRSRSSGSTRHCDSKRSRMSRIRGGVDKVLATLNKDDDFEDFTRNKRDKSSVENQRTPHTSQRSRSAPGSSTSIKTPARTVKKVATSRSAMTNKGAHKSSLDKTPNRFKGTPPKLAESNDELDLGDGVDDHPEDLPSVPSSRSTSPTPPQTPTLHTQPNVSTALKEITSLLNTVVKRMDRMENELKQHSTSVSSSSASEGNKKSKKSSPPLIVAKVLADKACPPIQTNGNHKLALIIMQSEVRKTYNMLLEDEENDFEGFDLNPSVPFNAPANEAVVTRLVKEVIANNHQFQACDVRAAARTYYRTKSQEKSLKERGQYEERSRMRRRRERLLRKLQERSSIFQKSDMSPKAKEKWNKVLQAEVMSSEESGPEEDDMFVKPLPWRSELVNKFFAELDEKSTERKTAQALRQRKKRIISVHASIRGAPPGLPKWAIN